MLIFPPDCGLVIFTIIKFGWFIHRNDMPFLCSGFFLILWLITILQLTNFKLLSCRWGERPQYYATRCRITSSQVCYLALLPCWWDPSSSLIPGIQWPTPFRSLFPNIATRDDRSFTAWIFDVDGSSTNLYAKCYGLVQNCTTGGWSVGLVGQV